MRTLTSTLTAAQKSPSRTPVIKLEAHNKIAGVERLNFTRLYTGTETESHHGAAIAGNGSLCRAKLQSGTIRLQTVTTPGPGSTFTTWTDSGYATTYPFAMSSWSGEVAIFYIKTPGAEIRRLLSIDNGSSYADELIKTTPVALSGTSRVAAAFGQGDNVMVFFITGTNSYVYWTSWDGAAWTAWQYAPVTGAAGVSEIAACGRNDYSLFPLALVGWDTASVNKLWTSQFDYAGTALNPAIEVVTSPYGSSYTFKEPYLIETDGKPRLWFVEQYAGVTAYERVFHTFTLPYDEDTNMLITAEPEPFNDTCSYGLAPAVATDYVWLCRNGGIWRAPLTLAPVNLSADILKLKADEDTHSGEIVVELRNDDGRYATPGTGALAALHLGSELRLALGYYSAAGGSEYSWANYYQVEEIAYLSAGGKATVQLTGRLAKDRLEKWTARRMYRWNGPACPAAPAYDILIQIFARCGLQLDVLSVSATAANFCPDFTIYPGQSGASAAGQILKMLPDVVRSKLEKCEMLNPQASDASTYAYGVAHAIFEARYAEKADQVNRVRAEGRNTGNPVVEESYDWASIANVSDRYQYVFDLNVNTAAKGTERGAAYLADQALLAQGGTLQAPVNCGQELYDVVDVTDSRAGLSAAIRRVMALRVSYDAAKNVYALHLALGSRS